MHSPISLIGVPTDIGAGARGASMGPEALRVAAMARRFCAIHGLDVVDTGQPRPARSNPWLPPTERLPSPA